MADLRDPWTDIYYYKELKHSWMARKRDAFLERKVLKNADQIITVSEDLKRIFSQKFKSNIGAKIQVIPNGYDEEDFTQQVKTTEDRFVITYTGTISEAYDISAFISALQQTPETERRQMLLRFVGRVPSSIVKMIKEQVEDLEIDLVGYVPHEKSIQYLLQSSMQLLVIPRVENNQGIITGKFYEYLASSKPILAIGPLGGDLEKIIAETQCGKLVAYDDTEGIRSFIAQIRCGDYSANADVKMYSRRSLTEKLIEGIDGQ